MDKKALVEMINAEDVHPWYTSRLVLVEKWASQLPNDAVGVDIGCGSGKAAELLQSQRGIKVIGYDISEVAVEAAKKRGVRAHQVDVTKLPIEGRSQDFAIALDVIEHIEDKKALLNEIFRVLRPGGKCLITVPAHNWLWSNHDVLNHHFRRYSKSMLAKDLSQAGFNHVRIRWWNSIFLIFIFLSRFLSRTHGDSEFKTPPKILATLVSKILTMEAKSELLGKFVGVSLVAEITKSN